MCMNVVTCRRYCTMYMYIYLYICIYLYYIYFIDYKLNNVITNSNNGFKGMNIYFSEKNPFLSFIFRNWSLEFDNFQYFLQAAAGHSFFRFLPLFVCSFVWICHSSATAAAASYSSSCYAFFPSSILFMFNWLLSNIL